MDYSPRTSPRPSPRPTPRKSSRPDISKYKSSLASGGLATMSQETPRRPMRKPFYESKQGCTTEETRKGVRRTYYDNQPDRQPAPSAPVSIKVTQPTGGVDRIKLGVDRVALRTTTQDEFVPYTSPRLQASAASSMSTGRDKAMSPRRHHPLVKPLQPSGGRTTVSLGTDRLSYRESLKEAELASARRPSARKMVAEAVVAGKSTDKYMADAEKPLVRVTKNIGGDDHISLGRERGVTRMTTERARAQDVLSQELVAQASKAHTAGAVKEPDYSPPRFTRAPSNRQTYNISDTSMLESKPASPRKMSARQPLGGRPVQQYMTDYGHIAGVSSETHNRHKPLKVTQNVGGDTSIMLG